MKNGLFERMMNNIQDGIIIGERNKIVFCSNRTCEIYDLPKKEIQKFGNKLMLIPDFQSLETIELWITRKDGSSRYIQNRFSIDKESENLWYTITTDITERKLAQDKLTKEKEVLATTLKSIGDGVITVDINGKIKLMNKMAEKITRETFDSAKGKNLKEILNIFDEKTRKPIPDIVNQVMETKKIINISKSAVLITKTGETINIEDSAAPIKDCNDKIIGIVIIFRDVTKQKKIEQELLKNQRIESIGVLAGGIAHDFNNILQAIVGNLSLINLPCSDFENISRIAKIKDASKEAISLTQQLLTFSKGGDPVKVISSISYLLKETVNFVLRGSDIKCDFKIDKNLWPVEIDQGQMNQVIHNIVLNAKQSNPKNNKIQITATNEKLKSENIYSLPPKNYIKIVIVDTGCGIPKEIINKIFDPYFTTKPTGTGIGLTSAHSIVQKHGGHIHVESEEDIGSKFSIIIPGSSSKKDIPKYLPKYIVKTSLKNKKILVLEDNPSVIDFLKESFTELEITFKITNDGIKCVEEYSKNFEMNDLYDVVILDLTIPGGKGGEYTIKRILFINPAAKVIASSGYANNKIISNYKVFGFRERLVKPYDFTDLITTIKKVLHSKEFKKESKKGIVHS